MRTRTAVRGQSPRKPEWTPSHPKAKAPRNPKQTPCTPSPQHPPAHPPRRKPRGPRAPQSPLRPRPRTRKMPHHPPSPRTARRKIARARPCQHRRSGGRKRSTITVSRRRGPTIRRRGARSLSQPHRENFNAPPRLHLAMASLRRMEPSSPSSLAWPVPVHHRELGPRSEAPPRRGRRGGVPCPSVRRLCLQVCVCVCACVRDVVAALLTERYRYSRICTEHCGEYWCPTTARSSDPCAVIASCTAGFFSSASRSVWDAVVELVWAAPCG